MSLLLLFAQSPSGATVAQQAAAIQQADWSEQFDHTITTFAPEAQDPYATTPFARTVATVPQQAGLWEEPLGHDQLQSNAGQWFAPEREPVLGQPPRAAAYTGFDIGYDPVFDRDQTETRFAPEASVEGFRPLAAAPNLPDFGYDAQQDRDQTVLWYQPDTGAEFIRVPSTGVFSGVLGTYLAQPGRFELGKIPAAVAAPATVVDNSTVAQRGALGIYDPQQDRDLTDTRFAPEASVEGLLPPVSGPTAAQLAGLWQEQPEQFDLTVTTFAPEASAEGLTPRGPQPVHPDYGYDAQTDRDQTVTWFAPEIPGEGFPPLASAPTHPDLGYDGQQDRDQTVLWFAPDSVDRPYPLAAAPVHPDFGYDPQQDRDQTETRFAPEASAEGLVPNLPSAVRGPDFGYDAAFDRDLTVVTFAPDELFWCPVPGLGAAATIAQEPVQQAGPDEQVDRTQRWYQDPDDTLGIPPFAPSVASVAQQAPLWQEQPGQDRSLDVLWYQPEDPSESYFPIIPAGSVASVPQQAALWPEQPQAWNDGTPWFAPEASFEGFPPRAPQPVHPDFGYDAQTDRDLTDVRFAPDASVEGLVPNLASAYTGFDLSDLSGQDLIASLPAVWVEPPADPLLPPVVAAPVAPFAPLWPEQPGQEASQAVLWFAPDASAEGFAPLASAPTHPDFGWDAQQSIDRTTVWFAPDASVEGFAPRATAYTGFDIGYDPGRDRDQTQVWYAPDELFWCPTPPFAPSVATVAQQPIQQADWSESRDQTVLWFAPEPWNSPTFNTSTGGGPGPTGTGIAVGPSGSSIGSAPSGTGIGSGPSGTGSIALPSGSSVGTGTPAVSNGPFDSNIFDSTIFDT